MHIDWTQCPNLVISALYLAKKKVKPATDSSESLKIDSPGKMNTAKVADSSSLEAQSERGKLVSPSNSAKVKPSEFKKASILKTDA